MPAKHSEQANNKSEIASSSLNGVSESLFLPLYLRALESRRPDALVRDDRAVELVSQLDYDFSRLRLLHLSEVNKLVIILRSREFDRQARHYLERHPQAVVVHIGCGLDARFERVDNGQVEWFDLDLPEVVALRCKYLSPGGERYHLLGCSVFDLGWMEALGVSPLRHFLFLAEGVFMYFTAQQVRSLVLTLMERFPGAELVFDASSPLHVLRSNLQTARFGLHVSWGIWRGQDIEGWGQGIRLLDEWSFFDEPEPRLAPIRWLRSIESAARTLRIYHFQL
jgi:O-methyltransferase involved in polyketide biosynthesis